ncbi:Uncharacterised protein [Clostridium baratii]|uniref:hypothetical protein n=1 Tax=Clostridium baratii TaxID=1561 RepID=UPI0006C615D4|nr:hypothetical protein [Clostridium baratii]CUP06049.1 Uncharacterised protein [Clostridium baratii]
MGVKMKNVKIKNCGTGIKAEGDVDIEMDEMYFEGNGADIRLNVTRDSNISINDFNSIDCKGESILINEYSTIINEVIKEVEDTKLNDVNRKKLIDKLKELKNNLNNSNKTQKIFLEIYNISKSIGMPLFIQYLKKRLGL